VGCVAGNSGVLCVDCPALPADARDWRAQVGRITPAPTRFVVLTDAHRDRIVGLSQMGGRVVAHEAAWEKMKGYNEGVRQQVAESLTQRHPAAGIGPDWQLALPQITFTSHLAVYETGTPVIIRHVGGPFPGSVWVHLPEKRVLFMGNLLVSLGHPITAEADLPTWIDRLEEVQHKDFAADVLVPARGAPCTKSDLTVMLDYLRTMRSRVHALARSRKAKPDMTALAGELMSYFPVPENDRERDCTQRRVKAGLDHLYDQIKTRK
jgi:glyoxylase-like metal-dependent hydrolase (beta-lactamase superfamily II)